MLITESRLRRLVRDELIRSSNLNEGLFDSFWGNEKPKEIAQIPQIEDSDDDQIEDFIKNDPIGWATASKEVDDYLDKLRLKSSEPISIDQVMQTDSDGKSITTSTGIQNFDPLTMIFIERALDLNHEVSALLGITMDQIIELAMRKVELIESKTTPISFSLGISSDPISVNVGCSFNFPSYGRSGLDLKGAHRDLWEALRAWNKGPALTPANLPFNSGVKTAGPRASLIGIQNSVERAIKKLKINASDWRSISAGMNDDTKIFVVEVLLRAQNCCTILNNMYQFLKDAGLNNRKYFQLK